jgi:hypothetical protein
MITMEILLLTVFTAGTVFGIFGFYYFEMIYNRVRNHNSVFPIACGTSMDLIGEQHGVERRRYFWILRESDASYRKRVIKKARGEIG